VGLTPFIGPRDLDHARRDRGLTSDEVALFTRFFGWAEMFLCNPHKDLGRTGVVCPYTRGSLSASLFYVAICRARGEEAEARTSEVLSDLVALWRENQPPEPARMVLKTMMVLLPGIRPERQVAVIDALHRTRALEFIEAGLMLGEFHSASPTPGLHNPDFRPLRSPIPLFAVRSMVISDLPFLIASKAKVAAYLRRFGEVGRRALECHVARGGTLPVE